MVPTSCSRSTKVAGLIGLALGGLYSVVFRAINAQLAKPKPLQPLSELAERPPSAQISILLIMGVTFVALLIIIFVISYIGKRTEEIEVLQCDVKRLCEKLDQVSRREAENRALQLFLAQRESNLKESSRELPTVKPATAPLDPQTEEALLFIMGLPAVES